jgi:hypothetical protein
VGIEGKTLKREARPPCLAELELIAELDAGLMDAVDRQSIQAPERAERVVRGIAPVSGRISRETP